MAPECRGFHLAAGVFHSAPSPDGFRVDTMTLETRRLGFAPSLVDYTNAWDLQKQLHEEVLAGQKPSTLLLLEHADVYTAGKRTEAEDRPKDGTPVVDVDRGGKITWHGRGQLVGYPILHLRDRALVKDYVCTLEAVIMKVLSEDYGITSSRVEGRSGVWITGGAQDKKIAAVGIRVHKSVTMHGFALNCSNELDPFENIIACGIRDAGTTSITAELGRTVTPADVVDRIEAELAAALPSYIYSGEQPPSSSDDEPLLTACSISQPKEGVLK
ncbi:lipoyl(octanoyl) transferase LipB [Nesterenkonia rhizosphaerae]